MHTKACARVLEYVCVDFQLGAVVFSRMGGESGSKNDSGARGHLSAIFPRGAIAIFPSRRVEGCFSYLKEAATEHYGRFRVV